MTTKRRAIPLLVHQRPGAVLAGALFVTALTGCLGPAEFSAGIEALFEGRLSVGNAPANITFNTQESWDSLNANAFNGSHSVDISKHFVVMSQILPGDLILKADRAVASGNEFDIHFKLVNAPPSNDTRPFASVVKVDRGGVLEPDVVVKYDTA